MSGLYPLPSNVDKSAQDMQRETHIRRYIDAVWSRREMKINWLGLEDCQRAILSADLPDLATVTLIGQSIAAYTRRGNPLDHVI